MGENAGQDKKKRHISAREIVLVVLLVLVVIASGALYLRNKGITSRKSAVEKTRRVVKEAVQEVGKAADETLKKAEPKN
jgi:uncharacterized protein (UPF0333 family)